MFSRCTPASGSSTREQQQKQHTEMEEQLLRRLALVRCSVMHGMVTEVWSQCRRRVRVKCWCTRWMRRRRPVQLLFMQPQQEQQQQQEGEEEEVKLAIQQLHD